MPKKGEKVVGHAEKVRRNVTMLEEARKTINEKEAEINALKAEVISWIAATDALKKIIDKMKWEQKRQSWVRWRLGVNQ